MDNGFTTKVFSGEVPSDVMDVKSIGKGLKILSQKRSLFTHEMANKFLTMANFDGERNLRDRHVIFIAEQMKKGLFRPEIVKLASCMCLADGKEYRINGQHSSWSRLEVSEEEYPPEQIDVLKYEAATMQDVRRLYATFDRGSPRTKSDTVIAYLAGTPQFAEVSPTLIKAIAEGFGFWKWESNHDRQRHSGDDVSFLLQTEYYDLTIKVLSFCDMQPKFLSIPFMRKSSIVAAMFETFAVVQKASEEFWHGIKVGAGLPADDPRLKLRTMLMTATAQKSAAATTDKKVMSSETIYRNCITAFNYWRSGEPLKNLRVTSKRQRAK